MTKRWQGQHTITTTTVTIIDVRQIVLIFDSSAWHPVLFIVYHLVMKLDVTKRMRIALAHYLQKTNKDKNAELPTVVHEILMYTPFTLNCNVN